MDFSTRYANLNANQRSAVDKIHGPLLVIAGPGTGKTELLSMRAAHILRQTDTLPSNILCLTFTDSGAVNMRQRLQQIIGEDAYKVAIHTFHSFGSEIINTNRQYFFRGADRQPTDELTQQQILQEIFESMDWDNPLNAKNNDEFIYLKETLKTISEFKSNGLTSEEIQHILDDVEQTTTAISEAIKQLFQTTIKKSTIPAFANVAEIAAAITPQPLPAAITPYANVLALSMANAAQEALENDTTKPITAWKNAWCKKNAAGEFVLKDSESITKLRAVTHVYDQYRNALAQRGLFDYDDMILNVLDACKHQPDLRANLQEQYQFIMVDEFQDTNLAQLQLLFNLTGDEPEPNIMAVGDDDQAIFSFQGANVGNIQRFRQHYHDPAVIVLTDNYRSAEQILTTARSVITQGSDRLENTIPDLSKQLTPHASSSGATVKLSRFMAPLDERAGVAKQIAELIASGTPPEDIAVISRRHHELIELLPHLYQNNISVNYEHHDDILELDSIKALELVARIVVSLHNNDLASANSLLPELLAHPAFNFAATDIWKLSLAAWRNRQFWLEAMLTQTTFEPLAQWLLEQAKNVPNLTLEEHIDELLGLTETATNRALYTYYFSPEKLQSDPEVYLTTLEALRTLRQKLRDHYTEATPTLTQLLQFIDLHHLTKTRLTSIRPAAEHKSGSINLMTAHKSKGLEFPHVFIIGATDNIWGEKVRARSRLIRYPANLQLQPAGNNYDERLRLFFVAMTRAKQTLHISHSLTDTGGKDNLIASFLSSLELDTSTIETPETADATESLLTDWRAKLTEPHNGVLQEVLTPILQHYKLSATHLNNFLDVSHGGPQGFLLNNLLHFPQAKSPSAAYGTAVHTCLQQLHDRFVADGNLPPRSEIMRLYAQILAAQHLSPDDTKLFTDKGQSVLAAFLDAKQSSFTQQQLAELNFANQNSFVGQAQLTGKLDLVDIDKTTKTIYVTDYKTGKPSHSWKGTSDYEKIKLHKYRQQLMFYQLLVKSSRDYGNFSFTGARLQFVEPDMKTGDILSLEDTFSEEELAEFARLVGVVWRKITTLDLPDISGYSADYKGMLQFEKDLLTEEI